MRTILYICPTSSIGGAETFIKQTWDHGDQNQFRNIYLLFNQGPLETELQRRGAIIERLPYRPRLSKLKHISMVKKTIEKLIDKHQVCLVHSTMAYSALFAAWACRSKKCPHIWFQHGPASGWMDQMAALFPHQGLIVNSHYTAKKQQQLEKNWNFLINKQRKQLILHLGTEFRERNTELDKQYREQLMSEHHISEDTVILSMLCRIQRWKGVHLFLEALKILKEKSSEIKFHAFIWGEAFNGKSYYEDLIRESQEHKLPITFAGTTTEPLKVLAASDLLINASIQPEPFGLSIIEAMSVGTPPLAPSEGGPSEIIKDLNNGILFQPRDAASLAQSLERFLSDKDLQKHLSHGALKSAKTQFNVKKSIAKMEQFYLDFL